MMKLQAEVTVIISDDALSQFFRQSYEKNIEAVSFRILETFRDEKTYLYECLFKKKESFDLFIGALELCAGIKIRNVFYVIEKIIKGGMLQVTAKTGDARLYDYENIIHGARTLILDKIAKGHGSDYSSIARNVLFTSCFLSKSNHGKMDDIQLYTEHLACETEALMFSDLTGNNGIPIILSTGTTDDYSKILISIGQSLSAIHLRFIDKEGAAIIEEIKGTSLVPLVVRTFDEEPLALLVSLLAVIEKGNFEKNELTVGFIGIGICHIRLTRLLKRLGIKRILGCDESDDCILEFEEFGGMATIPENVFGNADIIVVHDRPVDSSIAVNVHAGQIVLGPREISDDHWDMINQRGVKEYVALDERFVEFISAALIHHVMEYQICDISDEFILAVAHEIGVKKGITYDREVSSRPLVDAIKKSMEKVSVTAR